MGWSADHRTSWVGMVSGLAFLVLIPSARTQCTQALLTGNDPFAGTFSLLLGETIPGFCAEDEAPSVQRLVCGDAATPLLDSFTQCAPRCPQLGDVPYGTYPDYTWSETDPANTAIILVTCNAGWLDANTGTGTVTIECTSVGGVAGWRRVGVLGVVTAPVLCQANMNECTLVGRCPADSKCVDTMGSYLCVCDDGFDPVVPTSGLTSLATLACQQVGLGALDCGFPPDYHRASLPEINLPEARVTTAVGPLTGTCDTGYWVPATEIQTFTVVCMGTDWAPATSPCVDKNECTDNAVNGGTNPCGANAICKNTIGSYDCECEAGYTATANSVQGEVDAIGGIDGDIGCIRAVCQEQPPLVPNGRYDSFSTVPGSTVTIFCNPGWQHIFPVLATPASSVNIECDAVNGWVLDGTTTPATSNILCAADKDECGDVAVNGGILNPCGANAICKNTIGWYDCECEDGYQATPNAELGEVDAVGGIDGDIGCTQIVCQARPPLVANGRYDSFPRAFVGSVLTITCSPGWQQNSVGIPTTTVDIQCDAVNGWVLAATTTPATSVILCAFDTDESDAAVNGGTNPCGANAIITNTVGWYTCECLDGFEATAGRSLDQVNTGATPEGDIGCTQTSLTSTDCGFPPSYDVASYPEIDMSAGFAASGIIIQGTCSSGYEASVGVATFDITCLGTGVWSPVASPCDDIDECSAAVNGGTNPCGSNAICTNTVGWYTCECRDGFEATSGRELSAVDSDTTPDGDIGCTPTGGGGGGGTGTLADCGFPPNYANAYHPEIDYDIALVASTDTITGQCLPGYQVSASVNQFDISCIVSGTNFNWDPPQSPCIDRNECLPIHPCGDYAKCINNLGSYTCVCNFGFMREPGSSINSDCRPVTCGEPGVDPFATYEATATVVTVGTEVNYYCWVGFGFYQSGVLERQYSKRCQENGTWSNGETCVDIDECRDRSICGDYEKHRCKNTQGSFQCWCYFGYYMNADGRCAPVPEDDMDFYRCHGGCTGQGRRDDDDDDDDATARTALIVASLGLILAVLLFLCTILLFCCCPLFRQPRASAARECGTNVVACTPYGQLPQYGNNRVRFNKAWNWTG